MPKNTDYVSAVIIDDSEEELDNESFEIEVPTKIKKSKLVKDNTVIVKNKKSIVRTREHNILKKYFNEDTSIIEIGIDEAGRGPMLGRVYAGAAVLPKDNSFEHSLMKDSKKFHSKTKIEQVAEYIKEHSIAWAVAYEDEQVIDEINILQATQSAMHKAIKSIINQLINKDLLIDIHNLVLLVDGNYFKPYMTLNKNKTKLETIKYELVEGGDNKYTSIAAASILAKVSRDKYIEELCLENPELVERYGIDTNKGYGSKKHMDGIKQYGITKWHRTSFGICKEYSAI